MKLLILFFLVFLAVNARDDIPNYLRSSERFVENLNDKENFRLNNETWPVHYKVHINTFNNPATNYTGTVSIEFIATVAVSEIVLNQQGITLNSFKLYEIVDEGNNLISNFNFELELSECAANMTYEKIICRLKEGQLDTDKKYLLHFDYTATVYTDMRGLYESYYTDAQGNQRFLATTHFGQQGRRLLPCWDEPRFKARFEFTVRRNKNLYTRSVTNGKYIETKPDGDDENYEIDFHEPTSRISPYMLALVVSDFLAMGNDLPQYAVYTIYVRPNARRQVDFVTEILPVIVKAFDDWTLLPYYEFEDVKKIDMAAIPDFSAGAMENWGLLIHREANILADINYTNTLQYQRIAHVTSHEISHQWFGDLVTTDWWSTTWLNEGFARYFEYIGLLPVKPDWDVMSQFVVDTFQNSMYADASTTAHPLTKEGLYDYGDIRTMFTSITYDKGGSILRMIHNLMGDAFKVGIQEYLKENKYATVKPEHLFTQLQAQSPDLPITEIMTLYTEQPGFPLITATRDSSKINLTQTRFFTEPNEIEDNGKWLIPITAATNASEFDDPLSRLSFFPRSAGVFGISIPEDAPFYVLNVQSFNYHRVNYDKENWLAIQEALNSENHGGIHRLNRAQIIDDLFQLARSGYLKYDFIFDILFEYIKTETHYEPWLAFLNGLNYLQTRIPDDEYRRSFNNFAKELLAPIHKYLAEKSDDEWSHHEKLHWIRNLDWACKFGVEQCVEFTLDEFAKVARSLEVTVDIRTGVYCMGLRVTQGNWNYMWNKYQTTNFATEESTLLTALGCSKKEKDIHAYLSKILSNNIRDQDKSTAYNRAYTGNLENVDFVLGFITKNHENWSKVMNLGTTLSDLANRFTRQGQIDELQKFLDENPKLSDGTKTSIMAGISRAEKNLEWDKNRLTEMLAFFKRNDNGAAVTTYASLILLILSVLCNAQILN